MIMILDPTEYVSYKPLFSIDSKPYGNEYTRLNVEIRILVYWAFEATKVALSLGPLLQV